MSDYLLVEVALKAGVPVDMAAAEIHEALAGAGFNTCEVLTVTVAPDAGIRPFGRLDPANPLDQAIVRAWNKGAETDLELLEAERDAWERFTTEDRDCRKGPRMRHRPECLEARAVWRSLCKEAHDRGLGDRLLWEPTST